jgi:hypothetical protein
MLMCIVMKRIKAFIEIDIVRKLKLEGNVESNVEYVEMILQNDCRGYSWNEAMLAM